MQVIRSVRADLSGAVRTLEDWNMPAACHYIGLAQGKLELLLDDMRLWELSIETCSGEHVVIPPSDVADQLLDIIAHLS